MAKPKITLTKRFLYSHTILHRFRSETSQGYTENKEKIMKKTFFIMMCIAFLALLLAFGTSLSLAKEKDKKKEETAPAETEKPKEQPAPAETEKAKAPEGADTGAQAAEDKEKAALEEEVNKLKKEVETLEKEGGKVILLLDGKIKYTIEPDAVMDYEEIMALMEKYDPAFKEGMQKGGKDADTALLEILKRMSPDDRKITAVETKAFLKSIMDAQAKPKTAPAPKAEQPKKPAVEEKEAAPAPEAAEPEKPAAEEKEAAPAPEAAEPEKPAAEE